jgi:hypothetical protein
MADALRWLPLVMGLRTARRALMSLLAVLVLVQSVGVLHRVAHAHNLSSSVTTQAQTVDDTKHPQASTLLSRMWGEHSSWVECQLFDQTCPDQLLTLSWGLAPVLFESVLIAAVLLERFVLFERFYASRGPPAALI